MADIFGYVQKAIILVIEEMFVLCMYQLIVKGQKLIAFELFKIWIKNMK